MTKKTTWLDSALGKAQKALEIGSEAADVLVHLQGGITPLGAAAVGARVINSVRVHRSKSPEEQFADWAPVHLDVLEAYVYQAILKRADKVEPAAGLHEDEPANILHADNLKIAFALSGGKKSKETRGCWIPPEQDLERTMHQVIGRAIWESVAASNAVLRSRKNRGISLVAAPVEKLFESIKGDEIYERAKRFIDSGHHRSVFAIGEPGVGKTAMLKYIASLQGGFSLRIPLGELSSVKGVTLAHIVEIVRPDVLIIDDFDRFVMGHSKWNEEHRQNSRANQMLDPIERFNRVAKLLLVSANFSEQITKAMLRPERFDEIVIIDELEPQIYERLLPDAPEKVVQELKRSKPPVAYIQELRKRADVLGWAEASKEMKELMKRAGKVINLNKKKARRKKVEVSTGRFVSFPRSSFEPGN